MKSLPKGLYEQLINLYLEDKLQIPGTTNTKDILKNFDAPVLLSRYFSPVLKKSLEFLEDSRGSNIQEQINCCNQIIRFLAKTTKQDCLNQCSISKDGEILLSVGEESISTSYPLKTSRPITPLSQSSLFTGSSCEPSLIQELKAEILSADRIDILVSFIKWSGIRLLVDGLAQFCEHGQLRVITTAYTGATDIRAVISFLLYPMLKCEYPMILHIPVSTQRPTILKGILVFHCIYRIFESLESCNNLRS